MISECCLFFIKYRVVINGNYNDHFSGIKVLNSNKKCVDTKKNLSTVLYRRAFVNLYISHHKRGYFYPFGVLFPVYHFHNQDTPVHTRGKNHRLYLLCRRLT